MSGPPDAAAPRASAARVAAWVGLIVSLLLIPVAVVGGTSAAGQVATAADAVDERLAVGVPLAEAASRGADSLESAAGTIADTAAAVAAGGGSLTPVVNGVASFSNAYQSFRGAYQSAADAAGAAADRLESIAVMLPEGMAEDLRSATARLDDLASQLEASATRLLEAPTVGVVADIADTIAELARRVESALTRVGDGLDNTATHLAQAREAVGVRSDEITLLLTVLAVAAGAWLAYSALLNVALLRLLPGRRPASP